MKIAICGSGLVGSYLYRLLSRSGFDQVTVFDDLAPHNTSCGIKPCAWGTSRGFRQLVADAGLDPDKYILQSFDNLLLNRVEAKASGLVIDKPKLILDLLGGTNVEHTPIITGDFERIIDATGVARAYLPAINDDVIASCIQYRVTTRKPLRYAIEIGSLGYAWCGRLSSNEYHIGAGSLAAPPVRMLDELGWLDHAERVCSCSSTIRLTGPQCSQPFVDGAGNADRCPVWGVGEAVGCVAPLAGEGIVPGLKSAQILLSNWKDPDAYRRALLGEFHWMRGERRVIDKMRQGKQITLLDARRFEPTIRRLGMSLGPYESLRLLRSIR